MELFIIGTGMFVVTVVIIELFTYAVKNMRAAKRAKIRKRLRKYIFVEGDQGDDEILKKRAFSEIPFLNNLLWHTPGIQKLDRLVLQANVGHSMGFYLLLAFFLAASGFLVCNELTMNPSFALMVMVALGACPFVYLRRLKKKRIEKFKRQLPDGLDLIARALKAGHAFTGGMLLAAEEIEDPLGPEFSETVDEINFGVSVPAALKNLAERIDCEELNFFVVGAILQRETGGNLAELMETLANLIRERFKFQGKIRVLSAEGRISAIILVALPFFVAGWIWFSNPDYLKPLIAEPVGHGMILSALVMMIIGIFVMKKMVDIEV
jgi:tight adherence protein B